MATLVPVQAQSTQSLTNEQILNAFSEKKNTMTTTLKKIDSLGVTYYTVLNDINSPKWTTWPEYCACDLEKIQDSASKQLSDSSLSITKPSVPLTPKRVKQAQP